MPLSEVYSEPFPDLGDPRIKARLRLPEAYRSLTTSFFGSWCQGIPTCTLRSLTKFTLEIVLLDATLTPDCQRTSSSGNSPEKQTGLRSSRTPPVDPAQPTARRGQRLSASPPREHARLTRHTTRLKLVETIGLEPTTSWLQTRRSTN